MSCSFGYPTAFPLDCIQQAVTILRAGSAATATKDLALSLWTVQGFLQGALIGSPSPVVVYGAVLFGSAIAYFVLTRTLLAIHAPDSRLAVAIGADRKGKLSAVAYLVAIAAAFIQPWVAVAMYVGVAIVWLVPDRRIERVAG